MSNLYYQQLQEQSDGVDLKKYALKELEELNVEVNKLEHRSCYYEDGDCCQFYLTMEIINNKISKLKNEISELKGENK